MPTATLLQPFVVGGSSAILASCCVHPIDLSKVRLQLFSTQYPGIPKPSFPGMLMLMVKKEGFLSIYSGLSASLLRQAIYGTARIGLHRYFSKKLTEYNNKKNSIATKGKESNDPLPFGLKVFAGMSSGAIAVCLGTPCDVALVRMQADSMKNPEDRRGYTSVFDAIARVAK